MQLYSTNNPNHIVDFKESVLNALPKDKGLYMPISLNKLETKFFDTISKKSFSDIATEISMHLIAEALPGDVIRQICEESINFSAPVVPIKNNIYSLELFHGPTLAFKDFGARFMSRVMNYLRDQNEKLYILVATSGDTGGAVASGFYGVEGIEVVILFPKDRVSPLQQKQLTTLGKNITAIEIDGSFDDCQDIVKTAFLDDDLSVEYNFSSANSINIARLIPQSFYYFEAYKQLSEEEIVFVVPSGNFGNLTAGVLAYQMGLPVRHFVAATNVNDVVPRYLKSGKYDPKDSIATISNAMDVGNPSNFPRLVQLFGSTWNQVKDKIKGFAFTDSETKEAMKRMKKNYILDPHGAVGYLAAEAYQKAYNYNGSIVVLETAHPSKFLKTVEDTIDIKINIPKRLNDLKNRKEDFDALSSDYSDFKKWFKTKF